MKPIATQADAAAYDPPSKTQLKKVMHELQSLGQALLELPENRLEGLNLPTRLHDALVELKRTRSHEGRRRQMQYVGKLMRGVDPAPLREAVAAQGLGPARETLALHEAERWRDRLIDSDDALTQWMAAHPDDDAQALRTLIRNARRELQAQPDEGARGLAPRKGRAYRDLFRALQEHLRVNAQPASAEDGHANDE